MGDLTPSGRSRPSPAGIEFDYVQDRLDVDGEGWHDRDDRHMNNKVRSITLLAVFSVIALVAAVMLRAGGAGLGWLLVFFVGGVGAGVAFRNLVASLAPRPTRIRRAPTGSAGPRRGSTRGTASRASSGGEGKGRASSGGASGPENRRGRPRRGRNGSKASSATQGPKVVGTVKWFSDSKGFGFITPDGSDEDCFVHRSAVTSGRSLAEGKRVEFRIIDDDRGRRAAANVVEIEET